MPFEAAQVREVRAIGLAPVPRRSIVESDLNPNGSRYFPCSKMRE